MSRKVAAALSVALTLGVVSAPHVSLSPARTSTSCYAVKVVFTHGTMTVTDRYTYTDARLARLKAGLVTKRALGKASGEVVPVSC